MKSDIVVWLVFLFLVAEYAILSWNAFTFRHRRVTCQTPIEELFQQRARNRRLGVYRLTTREPVVVATERVLKPLQILSRVAFLALGIVALRVCWERRIPVAIISQQEAWYW